MEQGVLDVVKLKYWSFIPRRGSGRRQESPPAPEVAPRAIEKGRRGEELSEDELTALFSETRPGGDRGDAGRCGRAAGRAGRGDRRPSSSTATSTSPTSASSAAPSAASGRASARPTPTRSRRRTSRRGCRRRSSSARPSSACRAGSIPTSRSRSTAAGCGWPRMWRRDCTCTPTRRWRSTTCASARAIARCRSSST